jgi:hypothetical protein
MAKKNPTTRQSKGKGRQNILERINLHAACIDIGAHFHFVAVGEDCTEENVRKFDTTDVFWIVLQAGRCEGRSTASLNSRSVRCDELNFRSFPPTFDSTTKLQNIRQDRRKTMQTGGPK